MRVATWNLHAGVGLDRRYDLERVADVLRPLDADVVGLQEVDVGFDARSRHEDMAGRLGDLLGMACVFAPALVRGSGSYGLALLTRASVPTAVHPLPSSLGERYAEQRVCLEATVPWGQAGARPSAQDGDRNGERDGERDSAPDGRRDRSREPGDTLQVLVTHLQARPGADRAGQWSAVRRLLRRPGVVLGDLNEDVGPLARRAQLVDAGRSAGTTFPADRPRRRIDAVLLTPDLAATRVRRVRTTASDHLPVVVDVSR